MKEDRKQINNIEIELKKFKKHYENKQEAKPTDQPQSQQINLIDKVANLDIKDSLNKESNK